MSRAADQPIFDQLSETRFVATQAAGGPWNAAHCHGGAPAGLAALLAERLPGGETTSLGRLTFQLHRPLPVAEPFEAAVRVVHGGRRVRTVAVELSLGDRLVATASAVQVAAVPDDSATRPSDLPAAARPSPMPGGFSEQFEILSEEGGFRQLGPATVWFRLRGSLLPGAHSRVAAAVAAADFGSGIAHAVDFEETSFPSLDLTVGFSRAPRSDWVRLRSRWLDASGGHTQCTTELDDGDGQFGHALQTLLLERRRHQ